MILEKQQIGEFEHYGVMLPKYQFILINDDGEEKQLSSDEFHFLREAIAVYEEAEEWGVEEDFTYTDIPPDVL